jgi:hypothetical protein
LTFRDIGDTTNINSVFVPSGGSVDFIARVNIPGFELPGSQEIAQINASSQNDTNVYELAWVETNIPLVPPWFDDMTAQGFWQTWDDGDGTAWEFGDPSPWSWGPPAAYSPLNCVGTNIVANYTADGEAILTTPYIDLTIAQTANMTIYHWFDINGFGNDGGWVEVSDDFGASWMSLVPVGGYPDSTWWGEPCFAGSSIGWVQSEFDLGAYIGSQILIRFHFMDIPMDGVESSGWYIDDVNLSATYLSYGVELSPDEDFAIGANGTSILYRMTVTNLGTAGPDTFDLSRSAIIGWSVAFYDLSMVPISVVGPIAPGNSEDFYVEISIPGSEPPMTQETTWITATSQNDPTMPPASDTSTLYTEVLAPILYVDDDGGINTENEFEAALTAGGYDYNYWDYMTYGPLDLAMLNQYKAVIWATGNDYDDTVSPSLSASDRLLIGNYLDGGGRFYLSSSLAGPDAWNAFGGVELWQLWYNTYLHSDYVMLGGPFVPYSVNGTPLSQIGDGLDFDCFTGDSNPLLLGAWCVNNPMNDGETIFTEYSGGGTVAIKADTGTYRVVYTGFDFADVNGAGNRTTLMGRIVFWLLYGDPPYVIETTPTDGAIGIAIDQNIIVVYSETMDSGTIPTLSQIGGPDPGGWVFQGWSTTYEVNDTATWSHNNWSPGQDVNMSVSGGLDLDANSASGLLWNFSIIVSADPWATATGPTSTLTNNPSPTITYNWGNSPTNIQLYWSDDGGASWNMWGTDNTIDGSWPAGSPLTLSGTYYWSARAMGGPSEPAPSGPGDIESGPYVLDIDAPSIISTTPIDGATGVSTAAGTYVIEFNEPMNPAVTPLTDLPGIVWTWDPSGLWLNGTYTALTPSTTYFVDFTGLGFQDLAGNALTGDIYKNFTTAAPNPWATATGPISLLTNNSSPTITYNYGAGPSSVEIYWSDDGGSTWNLWGTDTSVDGSWPASSPLPASGTYDWNVRAIGSVNESVPTTSGDIESGSYILDIDAPSIISTTPADGATGVSTAAGTYVIEFDESMNPALTPLTDLPGIVWTWDPSGLWLNGTYTALAPSTTYYVDFTGLGFEDLAGNTLTGDTYKNFTTAIVVNPWAIVTGPISLLTNNPSPTISYNYGNGPTSVEIYWTDDGGSSWNLWGTDATVDGSWPAGSPLPASGIYDWNARAIGSVNESVPTTSGDIESGSYILDIDAPSIISTTPTDGATGVSTSAGTYVIEFDEPMNPAITPLTDLPGIAWTWDPSGLWLNGTYTALNPGTTYNVNLTGLGFEDLATNALTGDMEKNFTTAVTLDPWATATGPISLLTNNPSPTITYNYGNGPTSVEIYWSDDGGSTWNLWGTDGSVDGLWPAGSPLPASGTYDWSARAIGATSEPVPSGPGDYEALMQ